jgi:hypothetical protein
MVTIYLLEADLFLSQSIYGIVSHKVKKYDMLSGGIYVLYNILPGIGQLNKVKYPIALQDPVRLYLVSGLREAVQIIFLSR